MKRRSLIVLLAMNGVACSPATQVNDAGLPGVAATSSNQVRNQFVSMMLGTIRGELDSWGAALRREGSRALSDHYAETAVIAQAGGDLLKGGDAVRSFGTAVLGLANDGALSMLDFEVSDGVAYVYGAYHFQAARAGTAGSAGRHVTVFRRASGQWRIRIQLFAPTEAGAPYPGLSESGAVGAIELGTTESGNVPRDAYIASLTQMAALRRAWAGRDAPAIGRLFERNALLHMPGLEVPARGAAIVDAVRNAMDGFGTLHTVELDFTASGRLAVVVGRYVLEGSGGRSADGRYIATLSRDGTSWRIRSLVFG